MSWLMARIYDRFMAATEEACLAEWRHELLADVAGDVLEIGAGTGVNLAHYEPSKLTRLVLTEPDRDMRRQLERRLADQRLEAEVVDDPAEELGYAADTFDVVVSTLVLCSVRDPARVLNGIRRVLRPGGKLVFIEHVAAHDRPDRLRWQQLAEPVWKRVAGNCHLTRDTAAAIEAAGLTIADLTRASMRKSMAITRPSIRGVAHV